MHLGLSILEISKTVMYAFWYDYIKLKYQSNAKLYYIDTDSFIIHIKAKDAYKDIADVEKRFDTSNYEVNSNRPLPTSKNEKVIGLIKAELRGDILTEFVAHRPKTYSYLINDGNSDKKSKGTKKKCAIKRILKINGHKDCTINEILLKSQQTYKSEAYNAYIEKN